jgi:hypothetical protein
MAILDNNINLWLFFPINEWIIITDNIGRIKRLHGSYFVQSFKLGFLGEIRDIKNFDYVKFIFK